MEKKRTIDDLTTWEFLSSFVERMGPQRTTELIGWSVLFGVIGVSDELGKYRHELEAKGFSKSAAYRAAADFRLVKEYIQEKYDLDVPLSEVIEHLRESQQEKAA